MTQLSLMLTSSYSSLLGTARDRIDTYIRMLLSYTLSMVMFMTAYRLNTKVLVIVINDCGQYGKREKVGFIYGSIIMMIFM